MTIRSLLIGAALGCTLVTTSSLSAQTTDGQATPEQKRWGFLVSTGLLVPTGDQRAAIKRAELTAAQLSYAVHPALGLTATVAWARSRDIASVGDPRLDVFTYDLGAEVRAPRLLAGDGITFSPFVGVGAGARSYDYRHLAGDARHNIAGYGSVGGEFGMGRVRLRFEARDYVTAFEPLVGSGPADTRNDVIALAGLRIIMR